MASKKKSPGPVRMKPWKGYVDVGEYDGVPHMMVFKTKRRLLNSRGNEGWRAIPVLVTELGTPAADERIERVRKWCKGCLKAPSHTEATRGMDMAARVILSILDEKPSNAKPGRKR